MSIANPIDELLSQFEAVLKTNPILEKQLQLELSKAVRTVYSDAISNQQGYCMTLKAPENMVLALPTKMGMDINHIRNAFIQDWQVPETAYMYANPYYHVLLFLVLYGIRKRHADIHKNALILLLCKIWNGRKMHFIRHCNPDVMRYVVSNLSGKYIARKYENPMAMIIEYTTPTLLSKYGEWIKGDSKHLKRLFNQSWGRIQQLFISSKMPNLLTGKNEATSGLATAYYDAKSKGLSISKPTSGIDAGDEDGDNIDYYSSHEFDDMITGIVNYIVMNINPSYDPAFISYVSQISTVNLKATQIILNGMHNNKYADWIRDILELMFKQMQLSNKTEICNKEFFMEVIKKKFISSKHSPIITQLKKIIDELLEKIFEDVVKYAQYSSYSNPRQGHLRKVMFYGFAHNIQKFICNVNV